MNKKNTLLYASAIALTVLLSACAANIKHLVIAPEVLSVPTSSISTSSIAISTSDLRPAQHMLQIIKEGQAATLLTSQSSFAGIVNSTLNSAFKKSGVQVSSTGTNVLNVAINKALVNVNQSMMKYTATNEIVLNITIDNGEQTLTKRYRISGKSNGPLQADIAVLERDFNQQLSKVIRNMITDPQLIDFMR